MRRALLAKGLMSSSIQPTMLPPGPLSFGMTMTPAYGAAASSHITAHELARRTLRAYGGHWYGALVELADLHQAGQGD